MDFDDLLESVGSFGQYQLILLLLLCIPAGIPVAFYSLNLVFIQAVPEHWCDVPELRAYNLTLAERRNLSIPLVQTRDGQTQYSQCLQYVPYTDNAKLTGDSAPSNNIYFDHNRTQQCSAWHYDKDVYERSTVTDWDLVCSLDWLPPLVFALFNTGTVIGNLLFGHLQDRLGRKPSFFICLTLQLVSGVVAAFSINIYMLAVCRFLIGLTVPAILNAPLLLVIELVGPSKHTAVTLLICLCYSLSILLIPLLAYVINNWTYLSLVTSAPFVVFYILYWFIPESPRWLVAVNRLDDAEKVLTQMAKKNKCNLSQSKLQQMLSFVSTSSKDGSKQEVASVRDLFRYPNLRKKTICITMLWLSNLMVYIGLSYYIPVLSGSPYLNFFLSGCAELPAYPILWLVLDRWGRRWLVSGAMVLSGVACISTVFIPTDYVSLQLSLALVGKVCISLSFVISYIYTAEIYPTVVRGVGLGFSNFIAGIGNIGLPFIIYLSKEWLMLPAVIMGVIAVLGGAAGSLLPETLHEPLPQSISDGERFGIDHRYCQCVPPSSSRSGDAPTQPAAVRLVNASDRASDLPANVYTSTPRLKDASPSDKNELLSMDTTPGGIDDVDGNQQSTPLQQI